MEWLHVSPQIHSTFGSLGYIEGDTYHTNPECLSHLEGILNKLLAEDRNLRTFRRAVGFGKNIQKDLVPILIHVKDHSKIIELTLKILVNLTTPVECLLSVDAQSENNVGQHTIFELNNLLISSKEAFADPKATKAVLDFVKHMFDSDGKIPSSQQENVNNCLLLLRNILHVPEFQIKPRNSTNQVSLQNKILWNLFTQSIDKILLTLISNIHGVHWSVTTVQLVALIYKDQHVGTLQKMLNIWFESSLSDSSEDNESNTSPPEQGDEDSSPMSTSDPTSDSSDTGGCGKSNNPTNKIDNTFLKMTGMQKKHNTPKNVMNETNLMHQSSNISSSESPSESLSQSSQTDSKVQGSNSKRECKSINSETSDCGYVTQLENQGSISTSSNEEDDQLKKPVHQKPHINKPRHIINKMRTIVSLQDCKDKRRKKLVKRAKTNIINMKGLIHHIATDEDISNVLKEFTVDFLLKGYGHLVHFLHHQLLFDLHLQMDTSHFFWLITYFLKFAAQLELDLEHMHQVLSFEIISYLTCEGVHLCEQIQMLTKTQNNEILYPILRRMHLVITSIREFIQTVETYTNMSHLTEEDSERITKLQQRICSSQELRCLLVLLIRHFHPAIHSKQYLQDLVITNHVLLLFLDKGAQIDSENPNMIEHIKQFTSVEVMHHYGLLLEDFRSNGEYVNDCIFTMMHHVAGDLNRISSLFQPHILKVFTLIWETDFEICDDWSDLVEYVINQFIKTPRPTVPHNIIISEELNILPLDKKTDLKYSMKQRRCITPSWTQEDKDKLHWYYLECADDTNDQTITNHLKQNQSYMSNNCNETETNQLNINPTEEDKNICDDVGSKEPAIKKAKTYIKDEIDLLKEDLMMQKMEKALQWLQNIVLETCYAKICLKNKTKEESICIHDNIKHTIEPTPFRNILVNQSVPVVPWCNDLSTMIHNQTFLHLLHRLGFHLPADSGKLFVRIPNFWSEDVLLHVAFRLGPINAESLKFSLNDVYKSEAEESPEKPVFRGSIMMKKPLSNEGAFSITRIKQICSTVQFTPFPPLGLPMKERYNFKRDTCAWLDTIVKSKPSCHGDAKIPFVNIKTEDIDMKTETLISPLRPLAILCSDNIPTSEENSICETASVTSNLTRMCVSDEDEKHDDIDIF